MTVKRNSVCAAALRAIVLCLFTLAVGLATAHAANASPPERMTYQGFLVDANGVALGNTAPKNYDVLFRIYDDQSTGSKLWAEQQTLTVDKGYFSVLLGEGSQVGSEPRPALPTLFAGGTASDRFVEITVKGIGSGGSDSTILPRLRLLTSPYAFLAQNAVNAVSLINDTNRQVVSITGTNVGINKTSPTAALDVNGKVIATGSVRAPSLEVDDQAYFTVKNLWGGMNPVIAFDGYDWLMYKRTENSFHFVIASEEKLKITSSNVVVSASGGIEGRGTMPLGGIIMWSGATNNIPAGWALCNGQTVNNQLTPDLRDRFIVGAGGSYVVKATGGSQNVTLSVPNLPAHNHTYTDYYFRERSNNWSSGGNPSPGDGTGDNTSATRTTGSTGSGQAIDIRPPYYALAYIMRVQ